MVLQGITRVIFKLNWNCLCSWWLVHIIDSCSMQAMCGGHHEFFFSVQNWNSTRGKPCGDGLHFLSFWAFGLSIPFFCDLFGLYFLSLWLLGTGWICEHLFSRRVSLWYRYGIAMGIALGLARMWTKKEQFQALHANMNELIVFQDIARYRFW